MRDLLDPKNDSVFKRLFADAPDLLVGLINAVRRCAAPITHIAVKNPAIDAAELHGKYIILDLLAEDAAGRHYTIAMQVRRYRAWRAVGWGEERTPTIGGRDVGVRSSPQPTGLKRQKPGPKSHQQGRYTEDPFDERERDCVNCSGNRV
ncbi:PD-(D/E)XK nuclease family transposase [uncultured Lamprocystis sp.]|jgi:hypothetical protein|uniref:PD-(D/E)XK nuclease family transposase n=2 Tax=uncultured Lamprocystis sp. TaxID=543132 RepID=UPI0025EC372D|nr:PD-(D/E)XK nuclease family transposase [uncultured Lamprocystis sp.]